MALRLGVVMDPIDSITPYNRPWTDVVTGETVVMTQGGVTLWFDSATKEPGVVVGGYAGPTADRRVVIAHHALTGQRRVFFGMTGNYATGFYDDLLLESLDLALNGPPGGYTPDDPPPPVIAYELVNDDLPTAQDPASHVAKPYVWFPSRHPGAPLALLPEGNRPKLWQVSYPEGYPDPGSELDDLWSRVGEKR